MALETRRFPDTKDCPISNYDAELLNQLWQILPYAGVAEILTSCNRKLDLSTPAELVSCLTGIPFNGRNNQVNQDLRLITFVASNLRGPISIDMEQLFFSNPVLRNHVEWTIEPIEPVNKVSIGFYTSNYTNVSIGEYRLIPLLTTAGPAFYTVKKLTGSFETLGTRDMYVIVNANVSVKLRVTYQKPAIAEPRCFTELWGEESIYVTYRKRDISKKVLAATQQVVETSPSFKLFIRPADEYINLSKAMIRYLAKKSVKVLILNEPETLSNTRLKLTASSNLLPVIFPSPTFTADSRVVKLPNVILQNYTVGPASFSQGTLIIQSVTFKIVIKAMPPGDYASIFTISPKTSKPYNPGLGYEGTFPLGPFQQKSVERPAAVFPIVINFNDLALNGSSLSTGVSIQIKEERYYGTAAADDLPQSTIEVTDYVLTLGTPTTQ